MKINPENRAYCAGLWEGEGTIYYQSKKTFMKDGSVGHPYRHLRLTIEMIDREPLDLFSEIMYFGTVVGPYSTGRKTPIYTYRVFNFQQIQFIVCNMWEWLSPRRKAQISKAIKSYTSHTLSRSA